MFGENLDLLTPTSEHERIAAFQTRHSQTFARVVHEQFVNAILHRVIARFFTDKNTLGVATRALENGIGYQAIVENHVSLL